MSTFHNNVEEFATDPRTVDWMAALATVSQGFSQWRRGSRLNDLVCERFPRPLLEEVFNSMLDHGLLETHESGEGLLFRRRGA